MLHVSYWLIENPLIRKLCKYVLHSYCNFAKNLYHQLKSATRLVRKPSNSMLLSSQVPIFSSSSSMVIPCLNHIVLNYKVKKHPLEVPFLTAKSCSIGQIHKQVDSNKFNVENHSKSHDRHSTNINWYLQKLDKHQATHRIVLNRKVVSHIMKFWSYMSWHGSIVILSYIWPQLKVVEINLVSHPSHYVG